MNEPPPEPNPGETKLLKLPWQLVAGALLAVLAVALAVGLYANQNVRQQMAVSTPTAAAASTGVAPTQVAPASLAAAPLTPVQPRTAEPSPTTTLARETPASPSPVAADPSASPRPTVDTGLAEQVAQAYQTYWRVRAEALFALDTSRLDEVASGEHLEQLADFVAELRSKGQAGETDVEHHFAVLEASNGRAVVGDNYTSKSVLIDAVTHARLTEPAEDNLQEFFTLTRVNGTWKVVDVVRSS